MKSIFFFLLLMGFFTASCERTSSGREDGVAQLCSADAVCIHTDTLGTTVRMKMIESCYELVPGKYQILQSLWDDRREIKLSAEFWILKR